MKDFLPILNALSSVATSIAVGVAAFQLWHAHRQAVTSFEDSLAREYRELAANLPIKALLGVTLTEKEQQDEIEKFYRYFDLSNGQIFFRMVGRVSKNTWIFWCDGIKTNMQRPAFAQAWQQISQQANGDFAELRKLIESAYEEDPANWK